jgi:hypothetical protein
METMTESRTTAEQRKLLVAILNMTAAHREHEKFYSVEPREQAVILQRHSRTLHALADRWATVDPSAVDVFSPYEGADDLNAAAATQLDGVLFMEGEGEPGEITHLRRDLRSNAEDAEAAATWLATAMESSWEVATSLFDIEGLSDLLGERHRIIANNWQASSVVALAGRVLARAADLLDHVDFTPNSLRIDLAHGRISAARVRSAAEMIDHASDLLCDFASLVHDNERRWRVFRDRVEEVVAGLPPGPE